jgi:hypothetical protein
MSDTAADGPTKRGTECRAHAGTDAGTDAGADARADAGTDT